MARGNMESFVSKIRDAAWRISTGHCDSFLPNPRLQSILHFVESKQLQKSVRQ